jgi:hypothetical protein
MVYDGSEREPVVISLAMGANTLQSTLVDSLTLWLEVAVLAVSLELDAFVVML